MSTISKTLYDIQSHVINATSKIVPMHRPASCDFQLAFQGVSFADAKRLRAIWVYWEVSPDGSGEVIHEQLHLDHLIPH